MPPPSSSPTATPPQADPLAVAARGFEPRRALVPFLSPRWAMLLAIIASAAVVGFAFGALIPLIAILMERAGYSAGMIGANAAASTLAILVLAPMTPRIARRIGTLPALYLGIALIALPTLLFPFWTGFTGWFVLRFIAGIGVAIHWVLSETWVNYLAEARNRGKVIALYVTVLASGFALGPMVITLTDLDTGWPFWTIGLATIAAALPLFVLVRRAPDLSGHDTGAFRHILRVAPIVVLAGFLAGIADNASFVQLPVYGLMTDTGERFALAMISVFVAGSILLQWPLGWLADRFDKARVLTAVAAGGAVGALTLPFVSGSVLLWPHLLVWGGLAIGLYSLSLALLGSVFGPGDLARANAVFIFAYNAGNFIGPIAGGVAMDRIGATGLPMVLFTVYAGLAVGAALMASHRHRRLPPPPAMPGNLPGND
ncbi:MAG: MFS transporter [Alphaproteobacteria bacterium]